MSRIGKSRCQPTVPLVVALLAVLPLGEQMLVGRARAIGMELAQANFTQIAPHSRDASPGQATVAQATVAQATVAQVTVAQATASPQAATLRISGASMAELTQTLEQQFAAQAPQAEVELATDRTEVALKKLLAGEVDLAAIGRPLTEAEQQAGLVATAVTRPKVAIVVGKDNSFSGSLTDVQFARIFRGEITNWAQVGGSNSAIRLVDRPEEDDLRQTFRSYPVFKTAPFRSAATAVTLTDPTATDLAKALGKNGIGYAIVDQVVDNPDLKILRLHKTLPTDTRYPFSQPLLYVHRGSPSPQVKAFLSFVQDPANQSLIEQARTADAAASSGSAASSKASPTARTETSPAASESPKAASGGAAVESPAGSAIATNPSSPSVVPWWPWLAIPLAGSLFWLLRSNRANQPVTQTSGSIDKMPPSDASPHPPVNSPVNPTAPDSVTVGGSDLQPNGAFQAAALTNQPASSNGSASGSASGLTGQGATAIGATAIGASAVGVGAMGASAIGVSGIGTKAGAGAVEVDAAGISSTGSATETNTARSTLPDASQQSGDAIAQGGSQLAEPFLAQAADLGGTAAGVAGDTADQDRDCRIILVPRTAERAYVYWEVAPDKRTALQQNGQLKLRIHDVTHLDIDHDPPHDTQEYDCDETQQDLHVAMPAGQRDYLAELGYVTDDQRWLKLARSAPVRSLALNL